MSDFRRINFLDDGHSQNDNGVHVAFISRKKLTGDLLLTGHGRLTLIYATPSPNSGTRLMKLVIDLDQAVAQAIITPQQREQLAALAKHDTASLTLAILASFAALSIVGGMLLLIREPFAAVMLGLVLGAGGLALALLLPRQWGLAGMILLIIGTAVCAGGVVALADGSLPGWIFITGLLLVASILARSRLLSAATVVSLLVCVGASTSYWHAAYGVEIRQPVLTVVIFSVLAGVLFAICKRLPAAYQPMTIIAARTSIIVINFGFWVGSLWGDRLTFLWPENPQRYTYTDAIIPDWAFAVAWAVALIAVILWACSQNRRWMVNTAAVFGAIHFYTQYFEYFGGSPATLLTAGVLALAVIVGWVYYKKNTPLAPAVNQAIS